MKFAEHLKERRSHMKLSQIDLGKRVGLHYTQIGRYERGESMPAADILKKLAETLEVSTDYLMDGSTENAAHVHLEDRELLSQFKQVKELTREDQQVIKILLDAFLTKKKLRQLAQ